MSWKNKVIWSEGLFLRPQHFQQHDRYLEGIVDARARAAAPYGWGFETLELDQGLLTLGQIGIARARGVLPDGTPLDVPTVDPPPIPLEWPAGLKNQTLYLALPLRQAGTPESAVTAGEEGMLRYDPGEIDVSDNAGTGGTEAVLQVGRLRLRLLLERDQLDGFACLGVVRVVEGRPDQSLILDESYIPPCLDSRASPRLLGFTNEIQGLLHHRGEYLASRLTRPGQSGVSEVADFLLLVAVNRWEPLAAHLAGMSGLHPERLYWELLQMAGELASYTRPDRRVAQFPVYDHDDLRATFEPVILELREALSKVIVERAIAIELQDRKYGFRLAVVNDRTLFATANFVLAAKANLSPEVLHARFPAQVKVGPVEQIQQFVKLALPGIGLRMLPVAPRQIPYHAGFSYFEVDRSSEYWQEMVKSGGLALFVGGDFPGLQLELWAIRD